MKIASVLAALLIVASTDPLTVVAQSEEPEKPDSGVVIIKPDRPGARDKEVKQPEPEFESVMVPIPIPRRDPSQDLQAPLGSVVAWLKSLPGTPALPKNWVECNGQVLEMPDSPYHGRALPNLNGANEAQQRFLRGSTDSGKEGGSETHDHGPFLVQRTGDRRINVMARRPVNHLPPYYEVVWIMRVR